MMYKLTININLTYYEFKRHIILKFSTYLERIIQTYCAK
jgi:hypothetical protein